MNRLRRFLPDKTDATHVQRIFTEETLVAITVVKWVVLAAGIGVVVGLSTTGFLKLLTAASSAAERFPYYFFFLPVAFMLSAAMVKYLAPDAEGHGTEKVIEAVHKRSGKIDAAVVPVKLGATIITIASGGSAGKEGPCAQIGAGLSSIAADILRFNNHDRKKLVICGISAGFASVFGTPIAGAIFGVEVLFAGSILYEVLLPSFIAGVTAFQVSSAFGVTYVYHPIEFVPVFSEAFFAKIVLAGLVFGFVSVFLIEMLKWGERLAAKFPWPKPMKGLIGGLLLVALTLLLSRDYLGLGLIMMENTLGGQSVFWYDFILKALFTAITLAFGGSGGIVTPIFFVGCTSGALFGQLLGLNTATFAAIGMVALLAGSANTPIAASILSVELFGPKIAPYATVACVISFLMTGHRSVYPSQVLALRKSEVLTTELGSDMSGTVTELSPRADNLTRLGFKLVNKFRLIGRRSRQSGDAYSPKDESGQP